jgi:immune inhibitor A
MRRSIALVAALMVIAAFGGTAQGAPQRATSVADPATRPAGGDAKPMPAFVRKAQAARFAAADAIAAGEARVRPDGTVRLANGTFVDYAREGTDRVVTILAEFDDPLHGQIPEPDRTVDNSTYWLPDFNRQHYRDMIYAPGGGSYGFPSMRDYYLQQSSGRFTVAGQVSKWVHIDAPESEFGANSSLGDGSDDLNGAVYRVVRAALQATIGVEEGIDWSRNKVDILDRYDCDLDGNFNEPDGYVDHVQIIHAGQGEEEGGGAQGGDAIWSHSWYAGQEGIGTRGPADCLSGGYRVPGTSLWVGDYTIQPENGGVGVFAHEFGHDLGLPDLYDTAGGENGTGFWTLMSSGSWASDDPNAIGTNPVHMGAWEKNVLGWVGDDLAQVEFGDPASVTLGPAEGASTWGKQVLQVLLPPHDVTEALFSPEGGDAFYYWSTKGNNLETTMTRDLGAPLPSNRALSFRANYDIEEGWDYAYVEASSDGTTWTSLNGNLSTTTDPNGQNQGFGITGTSSAWVNGSYPVPAGTTSIRFRYWTDGAAIQDGFAVDSIKLGSGAVDNATDPSAWEFAGFEQVENGSVTNAYNHYYLAENRQFLRNDTSLRGAYNVLFDNWLEKQPYANGLLIWYRDTAYLDNNTSEHPGHGQVLPVDSHPDARISPAGGDPIRSRWQVWDATFTKSGHSIVLHEQAPSGQLKGRTYRAPPVTVFRDSSTTAYYDESIPFSSTMTAGSGLRIQILEVTDGGKVFRLRIRWDY